MSASTFGSCPVDDQSLHQLAFDALPSPLFVVDAALSIKDFNDAAGRLPDEILLAAIRPEAENGRIGEMLHCVQASKGCGNSTACRSCGLVRLIGKAAAGATCRDVVTMTLDKPGGVEAVEFLTTAAPLLESKEPLVLLVLEDKANWSPRPAAQNPPRGR